MFLCRSCPDNPQEKIEKIIAKLSEQFSSKYNQISDQINGSMNFAEERLTLAKKLFYKVLEGILQYEKKMKPTVNFSVSKIKGTCVTNLLERSLIFFFFFCRQYLIKTSYTSVYLLVL